MAAIQIKNGRIWDGNQFLNGDIRIDNGIIEKIGVIPEDPKAFTYDAAGYTVMPGLVDTHVHFTGTEADRYGINPEMSCIPFGVTAAADAGGAHANRELAERYLVKNVTFVTVPMVDNQPDFAPTEKKLALYRDNVIGLKVYFDTNNTPVRDITPLRQVCDYAQKRGLLVMVHCSNSPVPMAEILETLNPGDILTHAFHGGVHTAAEDNFAAMKRAKQRGVVIDAGFAGHIHTGLEVFCSAVKAGVYPDTISTDITRASAYMRGGRYGMTVCMSMARTAGMDEEAIFRAVTTTPAKALKKEGQWGVLREGSCADIAVLDYTNEGFELTDRFGGSLKSDRGYRCKLTIVNGEIVWRD